MGSPLSASDGLTVQPLSMLQSAILRLNNQSASCKLWSVVVVAAVVLFAASKSGSSSLLWATAPVALLAFIDGACHMEARRLVKVVRDLPSKDQFDPARTLDVMTSFVKGPGYPQVLSKLGGIFTFNVAPFYLALGFGIAFVQVNVIPSKKAEIQETSPAVKQLPNAASTYNPQLTQFRSPTQGQISGTRQFPMGAGSSRPGGLAPHQFQSGSQPIANFPGQHPAPTTQTPGIGSTQPHSIPVIPSTSNPSVAATQVRTSPPSGSSPKVPSVAVPAAAPTPVPSTTSSNTVPSTQQPTTPPTPTQPEGGPKP